MSGTKTQKPFSGLPRERHSQPLPSGFFLFDPTTHMARVGSGEDKLPSPKQWGCELSLKVLKSNTFHRLLNTS